MEPLPLIPTPPGQKLREFRVQFLPIIVFSCVVTAIFFLWRIYVLPPTMVAQVEADVREVRAGHAGVLTNLFVERFQAVQAGDVLAEIITTDPRERDSRSQMLRGQISLAQLELSTLVDRERLAFDYHALETDYLREQTELQVAQAQLPHQEFDVNLAKQLLTDRVISELEYRALLNVLDANQARIRQLSTNVARLEGYLDAARPLGDFGQDSASALQASVARLEAERRQLENAATEPTQLRAPIAGVVTMVHRRPGETLLAGETILSISSVSSERMVGYMRPPYSIEPTPGMKVQVRTRSWKRLEAEAIVTGVGVQFEVITNVALLRPNAGMELGRPVSFSIPETLKAAVIGGELVDVIMR